MTLNLNNPGIETVRKEMRLHWRLLLALVVVLVVVSAALVVYVNTDSFRDRVRLDTIESIEHATGGKAEIGSIEWSVLHRTIEIRDLTIHGRESASEIPFIHVDRLWASIKVRSLFSRDFSLERVSIERPTVHLIVYPDGTTNQPMPAAAAKTEPAHADPVQQLFSLALEHAETQQGTLIFNDRRIPVDVKADDVSARASYDQRERRFDGHFIASRLQIDSPNMRKIAAAADATLSIYSDHAQLQALTVRTDASRLTANGTITQFLPFSAAFDYQASIDMAELASIISRGELRGGHADVGGIVQVSPKNTSSKGKIVVRDIHYEDPNIVLRGLSGGSDYSYLLNTSTLDLPHIFLHGLGGVAQGHARVENWLHPRKASAKGQATEERGRANLQVTSVAVADFAEAANSRELPLGRLHATGHIAGTVDLAWTGSFKNAVAQLDLVATPPGNVRAGELPVQGFLHGSYDERTKVLSIASSSITSPASHLGAAGDLGSKTSDLRISATTSNLGEVLPFINAIRGPGPMPFILGGNASFRGSVKGHLRSPAIAGHLEASNFSTAIPSRWESYLESKTQGESVPSRTGSDRVHWDSLTADFSYSADKLTIAQSQLRRGNSVIALSGSSDLVNGDITSTTPFRADLSMTHADVGELQSALGLDYPVSGRLDLALSVSGTRSHLAGGGKLSLTGGEAYGQPFQTLTSAIDFQDDQVRLRDTSLASPMGKIDGGGSYNFDSRAFKLELHGHDFRLERSSFANRPYFRATGAISFDATGNGTLDAPVLNANARLTGLTINQQPIGSLNVDAVTRGAELQLTARSAMQHATVVLDGSIHLRGDMPGHAVLTVNSSNLNPLIAAFVPIRISGPTQLDSRIEVNGPFRDPRQLSVGVKVDRISSELEGIGVYNAGTISLSIANQVLTIDRFRLAGEGNRFLQVRGSAELSGAQRLDLSADGDVNLKLIQSVNANLLASGYTDFNVSVKGTYARPIVNGRLNVHNGAVAFQDLPNGLSEVNGTIFFNQERAQIQKLVARTGGGLLDLAGFVSYDRGVSFNVTATGKEIRIRYPEGVSSTATAALTLSGNLKNSVLSGDVTVTRFGLNPQFDFAYYLARSKEPQLALYPSSPLSNVRLDVHVVSTPELQVQTSLAKVSGNVDLHVRGTASHPVILGHINIVEGKIDFNGTTYTLERGDITFANPVTIDPILDIDASAHVRDYDITLGFHGSPLQNKLTTSYRSDPPLQPGDIIALLALGRTREEAMNASTAPGSMQQSFSDTTSNALLGEAINATISNRVQKIFGVSRVKIDPQVAGVENSGYARLTVDQQISNKVTLTYITNLSQSAQQIIQFEYNVNQNVSIIAVRDQNGIVSFDVRLRQRKR